MRLDRIITLGVVNPLGRLFGRFPARTAAVPSGERQLPVLMYHSISDDPEPAFSPYYKVCTTPARFSEHMQWLAEAGWRGTTLSDGLDWLDGKKQIAGRPVAITFDDGFRDFAIYAFPALQKHDFSATMYLPTAFIGDQRRQFKGRDCLTWAEVRELRTAGMEFGSHTVNHPKLVELDWPQIEAELQESKAAIEQQLSQPIRSFAYPFAFPQQDRKFTTIFSEKLRALAYESCVTTVVGRNRSGGNNFILKRLPTNSVDDLPFLEAKLRGSYDWIALPQIFIKKAKNIFFC